MFGGFLFPKVEKIASATTENVGTKFILDIKTPFLYNSVCSQESDEQNMRE